MAKRKIASKSQAQFSCTCITEKAAQLELKLKRPRHINLLAHHSFATTSLPTRKLIRLSPKVGTLWFCAKLKFLLVVVMHSEIPTEWEKNHGPNKGEEKAQYHRDGYECNGQVVRTMRKKIVCKITLIKEFRLC